jgi:hypothetical protein
MARDEFGERSKIGEVKDDSPSASIVGIGIPALVIAAAAALYIFWPGSDSANRAQVTPPAATKQDAPIPNSETIKITPQSEQKAPPAAQPTPTKDRDPRVDSQNSN